MSYVCVCCLAPVFVAILSYHKLFECLNVTVIEWSVYLDWYYHCLFFASVGEGGVEGEEGGSGAGERERERERMNKKV